MTKKPSSFAQSVYRLAKKIPAGRVSTYKELALALDSKAYQAIGQVLRCNPYAPTVPCHRVVASDGSLGGFRGSKKGKDIRDKIKLLKKEGVMVNNNQVENFNLISFSF